MTPRVWLVPALAAAVAAAAGPARADELTVALDYEAAPGCPDLAEFRALVAARLGRDPFIDGAGDHVLVRIVPRGHALDGSLEWRDRDGNLAGEQTFPVVTADCLRLTRAMGFALAVQIELMASRAAAAAPPPAPVVIPAQPVAPPPVIASPPPLPPRPAGPELRVGVGPSVGLGMSAGPVLLARAFGGVAWRRVWLELEAQVSLPATVRRADGAGFSQQQLLLGVAGCARAARWRFCVLANAGEVRMAGQDIDRPASAVVPVVEAGARVGAVQDLGRRAFLDAHVDGVAVLSRWAATLDQVPVWKAPWVVGALGLDAGVRFP